METNLKNKVAVVTGAGGVICSEMAKSLAAMGVKTALVDINAEAVEKLAKEIEKEYNVSSIGVGASVLDKDSLINAKKIINNKLGSIDYLINGAGGNSPMATSGVDQMVDADLENLDETFFGMKMEGFDKVFDLNFKGTILPTMVFSMDMIEKKEGSIVNISSMNSFRPLTRIAAYSAAKAAVNNFTQWLSVHFSKMGVRVNAIAPGFLLTNQNRFLLTDEATGEPTARGVKIINNTPMERYGTPDELQGTLLYLLSDWSAFVTGVVIPVDGGFSAYSGV
ncbi:SDR family oxidoreductase [Ancylomarina sp. 16SWW S1-10-2]|uniref:SDR family oxidoreductase n=1 Tax=Ancylomarina sp. 16SWW S1-10-2 TaxID=2499681 RepID=UPI0012AEA984|nr:SDR family oxidoreductase [Ancylomarina sp. 16SWW S1-10-2]MRT93984.1 SDR family oxidoreductase [Ancylomarina sp. 16SWW S1-10-2]